VEKQISAERAANTFEFVAGEWLIVWSKDKVKTTIDHTQARLRNDILPMLGSKPIALIRTPDVLAALRRIEGRGAIDTAHRSKNIISQIMRYADTMPSAPTSGSLLKRALFRRGHTPTG
jgi:integrase